MISCDTVGIVIVGYSMGNIIQCFLEKPFLKQQIIMEFPLSREALKIEEIIA